MDLEKSVTSIDQMTNWSLETPHFFGSKFVIKAVQVAEKQVSTDDTIKSLFQLFDKNLVEGVLIPQEERMTACISSQVGCSPSFAHFVRRVIWIANVIWMPPKFTIKWF